jgi:hypothetical protein
VIDFFYFLLRPIILTILCTFVKPNGLVWAYRKPIMAEEPQDYQVPPTRPNTPILRAPRIAEAPSRAEPNPPLMETSSPSHATTVLMAFDQRDRVNGDTTQDIEERSDPAPSVSSSIHFLDTYPLLPVGNRVAFLLSSWL